MQFCSPIRGGGGGEGEGEGEGEGGGGDDECDPRRGNFDCPVGDRCDDGACVAGEGAVGLYGLCGDDGECAG
jgi:hypothetical protein